MIFRSLTKPWAWCHCGWIQVVAARPAAEEEEGEWAGTSSEEGNRQTTVHIIIIIVITSEITCICYVIFICLGMDSGFLSLTAWVLPSGWASNNDIKTPWQIHGRNSAEYNLCNLVFVVFFFFKIHFLGYFVSGSANCLIHTAVRQEAVTLRLSPPPFASSLEEDDHPYRWSFFRGTDGRRTESAEGRVYSACSRV